ncbi:hypothetical protein E2C01_047446 [Portunus trituberculatus]|uniref:Uncharacterized protein n=1 Tax=Portunus trituberculatus TaxID=210409 RepID=A0A5B7G152_PORTR|nr:hypothetical protein [Portunus trituberculatus]
MGRRHKYSQRIELHGAGEAVVSSGSLSTVISVLAERIRTFSSLGPPTELSAAEHTAGAVLVHHTA